jgi:hypothetical protein
LLTVALVTANALAPEAIAQLLDETDLLRLVYRATTIPEEYEIVRVLRANEPDVFLVNIGDWPQVAYIFHVVLRTGCLSGLRWAHPITNSNILSFPPAKAGGRLFHGRTKQGRGTREPIRPKMVLDPRRDHSGALQNADELTELSWRNHQQTVFGVDLLASDPGRPLPLPTWTEYYKLLRFAQDQYQVILADLPEVVNVATAEVVRNSRADFVVCTPELPSLKMAAYRCAELEACEVPKDRIQVLLNRLERGGLSVHDAEAAYLHLFRTTTRVRRMPSRNRAG